MDSNYTQRIQDRRQVIEDHADHVLGCIPGPSGPHDEQHHALYNGSVGGVESVRELYAYLLGNYLPQRYPTLFAVEEEEEGAEVVGESCSTNAGGPLEVGHEEGAAVDRTAREEDVSTSSSGRQTKIMTTTRIFHNKITGARFPAELPPLAPTDTKAAIEALKILGETVEDDLLLLQQDPSSSSSPSPSPLPPAGSGSSGTRDNAGGESAPGAGLHRLVATITCNPSGFDPAEKMGKVLREIHAPVPSYSKIERSMERFFSRLEVGKSSCRVNWSITTNPVLFNLASNHIKEGQQVDEDEEIDVTKAFLRCELQTTTRLPRTRAVLFSFKTFMYPLPELRDEGIGPELADAIEGLRAGNAPGMWVYKGAVRWAEPVCEYLRS
ncbi:uncharacterized protein B0I36DRAFT_138045 [Microdochium trichocladiopsis]|uniref:Uncharacterized protein n=1 Tax=Microdochium trichocladiopsis TaxID=1682393 RepID=A0A9P9BNH1_9PEZI|nr:uncharacterized protein B0I36DRAFT_138045 [Microdochium trichocladiopsis]KAH7027384.1 hypothetical protein B0I36DRAFT_138045 [Microdochium trichocladiopsis]